jgi:cysteine desulfurase
MNGRTVYLDHNATTPLHPEVKKAIAESFDIFGNPSSMHGHGRDARTKIEEARANIADFIGADPAEIIFTGSGTEANNTVLNLCSCSGGACKSCDSVRNGIITTAIEHPCVLHRSASTTRVFPRCFFLSTNTE